MDNIIIHDIVKVYPDMIHIYIYRDSYVLPHSNPVRSRQPKVKTDCNTVRSLRRSKNNVKDIILCNKFDYWCTFTFDRRKHDRYNIRHCKYVMSMWLFNQRKHSPELKYVIVPELHKDGALHFHALLANFNGRLKYVWSEKGRKVYNATGYRSGYTKFVELNELSTDSTSKLASYISKYMTKDFTDFYQGKRYWTSQNLERPTKVTNGVTLFGLQKLIWNHPNKFECAEYELQQHKRLPGMPLEMQLQSHLFDDSPYKQPKTTVRQKRILKALLRSPHV